MSLSQQTNSHSNVPDEYWVGRHKPEVEIIRMSELHWTEQLKLKPKDTTPRPPYELGDQDNRIDNWDEDNNR
jgi:hypothetical protein